MARVLILDDDLSISTMVRDVVRFVGHEPILETSALLAITKHAHAGLGAAIIDYHMGEINGVDVLAAFLDHSPNTRRIIITASANDPNIRIGIAEGIIQRVIEKPFVIEDIRRAIEWLP